MVGSRDDCLIAASPALVIELLGAVVRIAAYALPTLATATLRAATMIPVPSGVRIWIATGHTNMRRGMHGLALQVQRKRDTITPYQRGDEVGFQPGLQRLQG